MPLKHVLGQTVQNLSPDLSGDAWCDWLPTEYVRPAGHALDRDLAARKPIVNVESDFFGYGLVKPYGVDDVRLEGWWFLLSGGGGVINLNGELHRGQEAGGADTRERIWPQRKTLKDFVETFDLAGLQRFEGVGLELQAAGGRVAALAEPGRQYAAYIFHAADDGQWGAHFVATPGNYRDTLTLPAVPAGRYVLAWIDPLSGRVRANETIESSGGELRLTTPDYTLDVALSLRAAPR